MFAETFGCQGSAPRGYIYLAFGMICIRACIAAWHVKRSGSIQSTLCEKYLIKRCKIPIRGLAPNKQRQYAPAGRRTHFVRRCAGR